MDGIIETDLRHGTECPGFFHAQVVRGMPKPGATFTKSTAGAVASPGTEPGTVEFRDRKTHDVIVTMSTEAGSTLDGYLVGDCEIHVTPRHLRDKVLVRVRSFSQAVD